MKKPSIPAVVVDDRGTAALLRPIKENIEILTGLRGGRIEKLPGDASFASVVEKLNQIIDRLNA